MSAPLWLFADILQKLMASFAFLVGGFWVVMNYVRNRTHVARLQIDVKAELVRKGNWHYLLVTCQAKNVGLSIIRLPPAEREGAGPRGSALLVRMLPQFETESHMIEVPWDESPAVFNIFASHRSIELGLMITEQKLIYQPDLRCNAAWVQLRVSAHDQKWSSIAVAVLAEGTEKPISSLQGE
jgi:hypothetical protein